MSEKRNRVWSHCSHCGYRFAFVLIIIIFAYQPLVIANTAQATQVIYVGVREDAEPFSYKADRYRGLNVLPGYGGYMIEICRRVLKDMIESGPFAGATVKPIPVTSDERFDALDATKDIDTLYVDMLCGPDSITLERLEKYNASHPVFLSGITFLRVRELPQTRHCKAVIGLVKDTTAQDVGLRLLARSGELVRFDQAIDAWLAAADTTDIDEEESSDPRKITERALAILMEDLPGGVKAALATPSQLEASTIVNGECPNGYEELPVKFVKNHEQGIEDLCAGKILYYLGDFDILARKVSGRKGCEFLARRETMTRESYGVYFRKPKDLSSEDATLFAEFNNILLKKIESEDILGYEFRREFSPADPSQDLADFFESFQYAIH